MLHSPHFAEHALRHLGARFELSDILNRIDRQGSEEVQRTHPQQVPAANKCIWATSKDLCMSLVRIREDLCGRTPVNFASIQEMHMYRKYFHLAVMITGRAFEGVCWSETQYEGWC